MKAYTIVLVNYGAIIVHTARKLGVTKRDFQNFDGVTGVYHEEYDSDDRFTLFLSPRVESGDEQAIVSEIEGICEKGN